MIDFKIDGVVVSPVAGDIVSFGVGRNQQGQDMYYMNYSQFIKAPDSVTVKNKWLSWVNPTVRVAGYDSITMVKYVGSDINLNRWFMYAPYSGVSISTWPNKDMRFNLKSVADNKGEFDMCLADFEANAQSTGKFVVYAQGNSAFGPYVIYKAV